MVVGSFISLINNDVAFRGEGFIAKAVYCDGVAIAIHLQKKEGSQRLAKEIPIDLLSGERSGREVLLDVVEEMRQEWNAAKLELMF